MKMKIFIAGLTTLFFLVGCAQLSPQEKSSKRAEIDKMATTTIEKLTKDNVEIKSSLDSAKGYAVINWKVTKVPIFGAGGGNGVIIDKSTGERKYIKVRRFDFGGGWGARSFKNLVIIHDETIIQDAMKGGDFKFEGGAEVAAGTVGVEGGSSNLLNNKIETHMLLDGGGSATATVRFLYFTVDSSLN
jgi:lipid-binding SYLF domain-containing protein